MTRGVPAWYQPAMLTLSGITVRLGGHTILDGASSTLVPGSRVGLIGRNGAGKSTLMKVIAGEIESDAGTVDMRRGASLGYLAQDVPAGSDTPLERVLAADEERTRLLEEEATAATNQRIGDIHERLQAIDAYSAPARAARILAGLGFDEVAQGQTVDSFSGGWRMRIALAALLFSRPDILLLDEPSNYLDLEAALWLESFLKAYQGTLLVISHERDLLNSVCDHILHLQGGAVTLYRGNYDSWERQLRERLGQIEAMRARQERQRAKLMAYVDRWRYKAHTARQAQSRLKALQRMEPVAAAIEDSTLQFDFPDPDTLRPPMILLDDASVGYAAGQPVLAGLQLRIDPDERIAFLGRNGNGKTTLARLLSGRLDVMSGSITSASRLRVGYFAQHQVEELDPDETPLVHMTRLMPDAAPRFVRAQLGRFGFSGDKVALPVRQLSGGERARLALALFDQLQPSHGLGGREREWLEFAALLHDIGVHISYGRHHKHSYYLIKNGDLRGFEPEEVEAIALVARHHRRGLPKKSRGGYASLPGRHRRTVRTLAAMLRLAEGLDRSHAQSVGSVEIVPGLRDYLLRLTPAGDTELELWAAQRSVAPLEAILGRIIRFEVDSDTTRAPLRSSRQRRRPAAGSGEAGSRPARRAPR